MRSIDNPTVSLVTVRNETATIKQMFEYAYREGLSHFPTLNFRPLTIKKEILVGEGHSLLKNMTPSSDLCVSMFLKNTVLIQ